MPLKFCLTVMLLARSLPPDIGNWQAANCLDIAAQELQNSGELDAQTVAAKVERIVDDADRNLTDIYHVMNLQRLNFLFFSPFSQFF